MKNLTIALGDDLHRHSRIRAAQRGLSMSRYIASLVERDLVQDPPDTDAERQKRLEALERFISGPKFEISVDGKMPTAEPMHS